MQNDDSDFPWHTIKANHPYGWNKQSLDKAYDVVNNLLQILTLNAIDFVS
jgi:hypothetical protein